MSLELTPGGEPDFRVLFESAPVPYLVLSPALRIVGASDAYLAATMTRRHELIGRDLFEAFPDNPADPDATGTANLRASLQRVLAHRAPDSMPVQKYDIRRPASEGSGFEERFWSPVNSPVLDGSGDIVYIIHRVEDVTEFVRISRQTEAIHQVAEAATSRAGKMEAEIFRRAKEIQEANRKLRELQSELESRVEQRTAELRMANEDLKREVQERRRAQAALLLAEEQFRQAQKLEAVGRLAGGIAHDFNNLLSVIVGYSAVLLEELSPRDPHHADIQAIHTAGHRGAELTRQLLAFGRQQVLNPQIVDLNEILLDVEGMLGRVVGEDVVLSLALASRPCSVLADRGQMGQVVLNLAVNARDALPDGGRLTLQTRHVDLGDPNAAAEAGVPTGEYALLVVEDDGIGMDEATRSRAFEPFFTTKEVGKGTGLGLAAVFGIVQQSGGSIRLLSAPGAGTTFRIYLPSVEPAADARPEPSRLPAARAPGEVRTILLVEDCDPVRDVVQNMLRRAGHRVLAARSPADAMEAAARHRGDIDILLTDVVMPSMNGRELANRLLAERPQMRLIFMSGYTANVALRQESPEDGAAFLQKPFRPEALLKVIGEI